MGEWVLATALLFLMGLGLGARSDRGAGVASPRASAAAPQTGDRPDPAG